MPHPGAVFISTVSKELKGDRWLRSKRLVSVKLLLSGFSQQGDKPPFLYSCQACVKTPGPSGVSLIGRASLGTAQANQSLCLVMGQLSTFYS